MLLLALVSLGETLEAAFHLHAVGKIR